MIWSFPAYMPPVLGRRKTLIVVATVLFCASSACYADDIFVADLEPVDAAIGWPG